MGIQDQPVTLVTKVRRVPLAPVALLMAAGIVLGRYLPAPVGLWTVLAGLGLLAGAATFLREHRLPAAMAGVGLAILAMSAWSGALAYHHIPQDHIVTYSGESSVLCTIRGRVIATPTIRKSPTAFWAPPKTNFLLDTTGVRQVDGQWASSEGLVRVTIGEPLDGLTPGRRVELVGTLLRNRGPSNPGQYDWQAADRYRRIFVKFSVPGADGMRVLPDTDNWLTRGVWTLRSLARRHVEEQGDDQDTLLLSALILGDRDPALEEVNRAMVEAGTAHMLSISGQHLAIFLGFVYLVLRLFTISPRRSAVVVLCVLALYLAMTEISAPLLRSAIMAAAFCLATIFGRTASTANALSAAAVVLLAIDPLQLFRADFQLSFGIVAGLVLLYQPIRQLLFGRFLRRRGLMVFRASSRVRRWLYYSAANWGIGAIVLGAAASVASAPLVAHHFGMFNPYAPLLSLVLAPLMTLVLVPAYVSMALAPVLPNLSAEVNGAAVWGAGLLRQAVLWARELPGLTLDLYALPVWVVFAYVVAVGLWLASAGRRRMWIVAAAASVLLAGAVVWTQLPAAAPPQGRLHVLDVAHGQAVVLETPEGKTILLDAGTLAPTSVYYQVLRPFLLDRHLPFPRCVWLSHPNMDHYNALPDLAGRHCPARAYVGQCFLDSPSPQVQSLLELLEQNGAGIETVARGRQVDLTPSTRVEVIWPPATGQGPKLSENDSSLVLRITCGGKRVLVTGDIGPIAEAELAKLPAEQVQADVLVLPHHGSPTPTLKAFIRTTGARLLLQSSSRRPSSPELLEALDGHERLATFRDGWIQVDLSDPRMRVHTMRGGDLTLK